MIAALLRCFSLTVLIAVALLPASEPRIDFVQTGEEFVGPFASWKNVKTDYGAIGDGIADDAPALQRALDDLRNVSGNSWATLYLPAGTYRLGSTLLTKRKQHNDWLGCQIIGEDPATTTLVWDGADGQWMFGLDAWYCKVSRLSFDGRGKADVGLMRWNNFSTYCELSDLWFRDCRAQGIRLGSGSNNSEGQAEHAIQRCRFTRCGTGILTSDWNTMDIYVWYCLFEDCGRGIHNSTGGYQAVGNVFLRSREWDLGSDNNHVLNLIGNRSFGSRRFTGPFHARSYVQGNHIYDPLDTGAVHGAEVLIDNVVRSRVGGSGAVVRDGVRNQLQVGNTFTLADAAPPGPRIVQVDQRVVPASELPVPTQVQLPGTPQRRERSIITVQRDTGDDARELQRCVDDAAKEAPGSRPVVHLPKGLYLLKTTVVLPAGSDLHLIGDSGAEHGSVLRWGGDGPGPGLLLRGPSRVTMRDFALSFVGSGADALHIEQADQSGGRIYADQVLVRGNDAGKRCDTAILIDGVEQSDVTYLNGGWGEYTRAGVLVRGGPQRSAGRPADGQVSLLLGALGNNEFALIDVQQGGEVVACGFRDEMPKAGGIITLGPQSQGSISIMGMSWAGMPSTSQPFMRTRDFHGQLNYVGNAMGEGYGDNDGSLFVEIAGDGSRTQVFCAANDFTSRHSKDLAGTWRDTSAPPADSILLVSHGGAVNQTKHDLPNVVAQRSEVVPDAARIRAGLQAIRRLRIEPPSERPIGVTDVKLFRVLITASAGRMGMVIRR